MVDAMVYATALAYNAPLFTSDADFDGLPFVNRVG
ncbi:MAG: PIN domain-containing protein [Thermodesulfobacteriota bacterium]